MARIAYCATDALAKVYIDRYLGHQHNLNMTPNRLSFEQYPVIATNQHPLVKAIGVRWYRSIPIVQCNRLARVSIDAYCPILTGSQGCQSISTDNLLDLQGFDRYLLLTNLYPTRYCLEQHTYTVCPRQSFEWITWMIALCTLTYLLPFVSKQHIYDYTWNLLKF